MISDEIMAGGNEKKREREERGEREKEKAAAAAAATAVVSTVRSCRSRRGHTTSDVGRMKGLPTKTVFAAVSGSRRDGQSEVVLVAQDDSVQSVIESQYGWERGQVLWTARWGCKKLQPLASDAADVADARTEYQGTFLVGPSLQTFIITSTGGSSSVNPATDRSIRAP